MSIVQASCDKWATTLTGFLSQPEVSAISFTSPESGETAGSLTITEGSTRSGARVRVVDTRLLIPALGLDAAMVHAFAPSESTSPHLLSDLATMHDPTPDGGTEMTWHFHVDLMPRVDLITAPEFIDAVYPGSLAPSFDQPMKWSPETCSPPTRIVGTSWLTTHRLSLILLRSASVTSSIAPRCSMTKPIRCGSTWPNSLEKLTLTSCSPLFATRSRNFFGR